MVLVPAALAVWSFPVSGEVVVCICRATLFKDVSYYVALVFKPGCMNCFTGDHETEQSSSLIFQIVLLGDPDPPLKNSLFAC